jgi:uncharacterized membrane protein YkvA (DUF1232 family)
VKISFELSPRDISYFRDRLQRVKRSASTLGEDRIVSGAAQLVAQAVAADPPEFVRDRLQKLEILIAMLRDDEWGLQGADRSRILDALAYFVDPEDLIPDGLPGIGYLDDAIMVELVVGELRHEIEAYQDFREFRRTHAQAEVQEKLAARREQLQTRMRRRSRRDRERRRSSTGASRSPLRLW